MDADRAASARFSRRVGRDVSARVACVTRLGAGVTRRPIAEDDILRGRLAGPGKYGHLNSYTHELFVDEVLDMKSVTEQKPQKP